MNAISGITYHRDLIQGSDEWLAARCGLLTASEMRLIMTPLLAPANTDKARAHVWELLAQRITGHVEPHYISDDMLRGQEDEIEARALYAQHYAPVQEVGFITSNRWGFTIGYSPDGLVGDDGLIEIKSRRQKYQVQTVVENVGIDNSETIPADFMLQAQTGLLVTGRQWLDLISYSGGLPMVTIRVRPIAAVHEAIIAAASAFEKKLASMMEVYNHALTSDDARLLPTVRRIEQEMHL